MFNPSHLRSLRQALTEESCWRRPPPVTVASAAGSATTMPTATSDPAPAATPQGPLRLTDDQLAAVLRAAEPPTVGDRDAFLQDVAAALQGQELGDGTVYRVVAQVQRRYYDPPILGPGPQWERRFLIPALLELAELLELTWRNAPARARTEPAIWLPPFLPTTEQFSRNERKTHRHLQALAPSKSRYARGRL